MSHNSRCSKSTKSQSKCKCECNGYMHGVPYSNYNSYKEYKIFNVIHEETNNSNPKDKIEYIKDKIKDISKKVNDDKAKLEVSEDNLKDFDDGSEYEGGGVPNPELKDKYLEYKDFQGRYSRGIVCKICLYIYMENKSPSTDTFFKSVKTLKEDLQEEVINKLSDELSDNIVNEILNQVSLESDKEKGAVKWYINKLLYSHLICTLCAYVLQVLDKIEKKLYECISDIASCIALNTKDYIVSRIKEKYNVELPKYLENNIEESLKKSIKKLLEKIIKISLLSEEKIDIVCVVGLSSCPNISDHPEIIKYCANPLLKKYLKPILQNKIRGEIDKCLNDPQRIENLEKYIEYLDKDL